MEQYTEFNAVFCKRYDSRKPESYGEKVVILMANLDFGAFQRALCLNDGGFEEPGTPFVYTDFYINCEPLWVEEAASYEWCDRIAYVYDWETGEIAEKGEDFDFSTDEDDAGWWFHGITDVPTEEEAREEMMAELGDFWILGLC